MIHWVNDELSYKHYSYTVANFSVWQKLWSPCRPLTIVNEIPQSEGLSGSPPSPSRPHCGINQSRPNNDEWTSLMLFICLPFALQSGKMRGQQKKGNALSLALQILRVARLVFTTSRDATDCKEFIYLTSWPSFEQVLTRNPIRLGWHYALYL